MIFIAFNLKFKIVLIQASRAPFPQEMIIFFLDGPHYPRPINVNRADFHHLPKVPGLEPKACDDTSNRENPPTTFGSKATPNVKRIDADQWKKNEIDMSHRWFGGEPKTNPNPKKSRYRQALDSLGVWVAGVLEPTVDQENKGLNPSHEG